MALGWAFGDFRLVPGTGELWRGAQEIKLTPRAAAVLALLAERAQQIVTKEELIARVWDNKAVGDEALTSCIRELRRALGDDSREPRYIETRHRRGYRLLAGVTRADAAPVAASAPDRPEKPSIVVLPFASAEEAHFADGITEDIVTGLSRFRSLFVIAWSSSQDLRTTSPDVRAIAAELGIQYVVQGTIHKAGNQVRVDARLIDADTRQHVWAERYVRALDDVFALQEEISRSVVGAVAPHVEASELDRVNRRAPRDLKAWELSVQAMTLAHRSFGQADVSGLDCAMALADRALEIEPTTVRAWCARAYTFWMRAHHRVVSLAARADTLASGLDAAERALVLDPADHQPHAIKGFVHLTSERHDDALQAMRRAHELNPNDARTLNGLGYAECLLGNGDVALGFLLQAARLNPRDPWIGAMHCGIGDACFVAGDYVTGIEWGLKGKHALPNFVHAYNCLALNYVGAGRMDEARDAIDAMRRVGPDFLEQRLQGYSLFKRPQDRARTIGFLRRAAGLE